MGNRINACYTLCLVRASCGFILLAVGYDENMGKLIIGIIVIVVVVAVVYWFVSRRRT